MDENNVTRLDYQGKEIFLIATAHVSKESAELVKKVIDEERPDSVCIELDEERYENIQNPKAWENTDIVKVIKNKKIGFLIASMILSSYQKKMATKLDTVVGGEMLQGIASAKEVGAEIVLADRNIQTTFLRIWRKLSFWEKVKLFGSFLFSSEEDADVTNEQLQDLLKEDMLESAMSTLHQQLPQVGEVLINERDQFLANKIKNAPGKKVVAVLGGGHVPGIKKEIYKEQDMESISIVPPKSRFSKIAGWIIPGIITALLVYSFFVNLETGLQQLSTWVIWTGVFAAIFTALSLAHPLSILTSLLVAPLTTLHPLLACGWFAGLVEATIKKPTVKDIQNIQDDIFSFKGFFTNRFLKTILVVVMSNIGGTIGTLIAGSNLIKNLF
ncbi:TraB/GumN family protein [Lachnospiraceae bacterium MD1]|jgi:pheromone shutdown-related protein TraB|uniref:TraB/GumN family protein n=1 Tax=Variimorphobacter saccharofermentans TaxID=2755051 RepID=A0A839K0J0_9FIRM|nr:TraB/GumN family protein [Variimorphobacter saccharofermentans]MBB2183214.1 TraB/GumN family protein [Variimorphobacter saccharofermentans]